MNGLLAAALLTQLVSSHPAPVDAPTAAGGLTWTLPKGWKAAPKASTMRLATYAVPRAAGDPADPEVGVFYFGEGQGGSLDSNIARWVGQLQPEKGDAASKTRKIDVAGVPVTLISAEGTFASGMGMGGPSTPMRGWALSGAIAEGPKGMVFFKMTGPKKSVARAAPELETLVKSLGKVGLVNSPVK